MSVYHFVPTAKTAELIHRNYRLLYVIQRFGIGLGFGDRSVREVCREHGIDTELFLLICNVYTFDQYHPGPEELASVDADGLVKYLKQSHKEYLQRLTSLRAGLTGFAGAGATASGKALSQFFDEYYQEIVNHFEYEEQTVFPYIQRLCEGESASDNFQIGQFEDNHGNIEEKLHDLKNILIKYLPADNSAERMNRELIELFLLEEDLDKHTLIENKILVPVVLHLEEHSQR